MAWLLVWVAWWLVLGGVASGLGGVATEDEEEAFALFLDELNVGSSSIGVGAAAAAAGVGLLLHRQGLELQRSRLHHPPAHCPSPPARGNPLKELKRLFCSASGTT